MLDEVVAEADVVADTAWTILCDREGDPMYQPARALVTRSRRLKRRRPRAGSSTRHRSRPTVPRRESRAPDRGLGPRGTEGLRRLGGERPSSRRCSTSWSTGAGIDAYIFRLMASSGDVTRRRDQRRRLVVSSSAARCAAEVKTTWASSQARSAVRLEAGTPLQSLCTMTIAPTRLSLRLRAAEPRASTTSPETARSR